LALQIGSSSDASEIILPTANTDIDRGANTIGIAQQGGDETSKRLRSGAAEFGGIWRISMSSVCEFRRKSLVSITADTGSAINVDDASGKPLESAATFCTMVVVTPRLRIGTTAGSAIM